MCIRDRRAGADDIEVGPADDFEILGPLCGVLRLPVIRSESAEPDAP